MLAPGIGAAAAEQQHLRDPGYSVRVARGPTEQRETTRPAGACSLLNRSFSWHEPLHISSDRLSPCSVPCTQSKEKEPQQGY